MINTMYAQKEKKIHFLSINTYFLVFQFSFCHRIPVKINYATMLANTVVVGFRTHTQNVRKSVANSRALITRSIIL